jgi:hypothetical protein
MCVLNSFLFCCRLKVGAFIIGWWNILSCLAFFVLSVLNIIQGLTDCELKKKKMFINLINLIFKDSDLAIAVYSIILEIFLILFIVMTVKFLNGVKDVGIISIFFSMIINFEPL